MSVRTSMRDRHNKNEENCADTFENLISFSEDYAKLSREEDQLYHDKVAIKI